MASADARGAGKSGILGLMIAAGVDPGTLKAGVSIIEVSGNSFWALHLETISISRKHLKSWRVGELMLQLLLIFRKFRPAVVGLERAYVGRDPHAALAIGEARGAVMGAARVAAVRVEEYAASEARKAVLLKGNATKPEAARMAARLLGLDGIHAPDEGDAAVLAIAAAVLSPSIEEAPEKEPRVDSEIRALFARNTPPPDARKGRSRGSQAPAGRPRRGRPPRSCTSGAP